ncbi:MAG: hypothetical protein IKC37_04185 [Clostridia bacterium]|nr:hypothetical protein [Clostridia bacterium]
MRKTKIVTIVLSVVLFLSIAVLGVANVFRVQSVELKVSSISSKAEDDIKALQEELNTAYVGSGGSNLLFVDRSVADYVVNQDKYSYFRITAFNKVFPNHIEIEVKEDEEMFTLQVQEQSYFLGIDGVYLGQVARGDTDNNVKVTGLSAPTSLGQVIGGGEKEDGFVSVVKAMATVDGMGGTLRGNVSSIAITSSDAVSGRLDMTITMKEGVVGTIYNFHQNSVEKATLFIEKYLSLEDDEKVTGIIIVATDIHGDLLADWFPSIYN